MQVVLRPSMRFYGMTPFEYFRRSMEDAIHLDHQGQMHMLKSLQEIAVNKKEVKDVAIKWLDQLDAERKNDPSQKDIVLPFPDPASPEMSLRYREAFSRSLDEFIKQGQMFHRIYPTLDSPKPRIHSFLKLSPGVDPQWKKEEFDAMMLFYFRLINRRVFMEELTFTDEKVGKLYEHFLKVDLNDDAETAAALEAIVKELDIHPDAALNWIQVFSTWNDIPCVENAMFFPVVGDLEKYDVLKEFSVTSHATGWTNESTKPPKEDSANKKSGNQNEKSSGPGIWQPTPQNYMKFSIAVMLSGFLAMYMIFSEASSEHEISFQEFCADYLRKNLVSKIHVINKKTAVIELNENGRQLLSNRGATMPSSNYYFNIGLVESFERQLKAVQDEYKIPESLRVPVVYTTEGSLAKVLINFLPTLLFLGAIYYMTKKASLGAGGPLSFGKSQAKKFNQEKDIKIRFKDVAGMAEAKQEVMEFVKFLQNPAKYEKLGAKIPRGAILSGPPGTGKTLIARATAGEAGVPFYSVSGSEFVEMFVGVGASRVRDLFKTARENAPSIVFVDEIDAIGKNRAKGNASGANDERESTLNQLLVEMDGFDSSSHVVVLAGTNRPDILDKALMRPGRFDRHISIDNPELQGRIEIFNVHLKKIKVVENIDKDLAGRLAALTPGFSGADIANVCNEAALIAARYNAKAVTLRHFELAIERVIGGVEKKSKLLDPQEKRIVAYHEAGHAVCGWFLKYAHPLLKVSIIPRGQGALGYAQYLPPDQYLMSTLQLYDRMIMTLGGRVSEELNFASVTSGAHDDFKKVTQIAQSMVMRFGMSDKVGMVNYADTQSQDNLTKPFSDETNDVIDQEIRRIVQECYDRCKQLLTEKKEAVELVAQELLKKEFITREDMIRLLGKRPFPETNDAFDKYLDGKPAYQNEKPADEKKDDEQ